MSDPIDIVIQDRVSPAIAGKLKAIAAEARESYAAIEQLKASIKTVNTAGLHSFTTSTNAASQAVSKQAIASQRLATEQQRTAAVTARTTATLNQAVLVAQRLATEEQRTAAAMASASAAQDRAAASALRLKQSQNSAKDSAAAMSREAEQLRRSINPLYAAEAAHNDAMVKAGRLFRANAIDANTYGAALQRSRAQLQAARTAQEALNNANVKGARVSQLNRMHLTNLGFQIQDIGVSLASGQNPLTVMIQQGAQIGGIASQAQVSIGRLALEAGKMISKFIPITAALGVVVGGFQLFNAEVAKKANLEGYAQSLGLAADEMKQLEGVTITTGDSIRGLWRTFDQATGVSKILTNVKDWAIDSFKSMVSAASSDISRLIAIFRAGGATIVEVWARLPTPLKKPIFDAINAMSDYMEFFVNSSIDGINTVIQGFNAISPVQISALANVSFGQLDTSFAESNGKTLAQTFIDSYTTEFENMQSSTSKFMDNWQENTINSAKERIKLQADELIADRSETKSKKEKTKVIETLADAYSRIKKELEEELILLNMLPQARAVEQRVLQIQNELKQKNLQLTKEQTAAIREELQAIVERNQVAQIESQILGETVEKRREFTRQLQALYSLRNNRSSGFNDGDLAQTTTGMMGGMGIDTSGFQSSIDAQLAANAEYFEQLERMRADDLITATDYERAKTQLAIKENQIKQTAFRGFLGEMSSLQNSNIKELAALGKAAAITQAIINTYEGATKALAQGGIMGPIMAGVVIASGFAQVAAIRSQNAGFQKGGYTGNMPTNAVAGDVHGQEYVFDAASTKRIGVSNLEALRNGGLQSMSTVGASMPAANNASFKVTVINNANNSEVSTREERDESGNVDMIVTIDNIESALASRVSSGTGALHNATRDKFNLQSVPAGR